MKLFLLFTILFCITIVRAQSCTKITYTSVSAMSDSIFSETGSELTICGNKTALYSTLAGFSTRLITNPETHTSLMLTDYGTNNKMAIALAITTVDSVDKVRYEDFHFTGKTKVILGYNCEEFTIGKENGMKASGYLTRELQLEGNEAQGMLTFSLLGTVLECTFELGFGMSSSITVTKVEPVSIENQKAYFSTEAPEGYQFINANPSAKN
jgi:hypothetical protein